MNELTLAEMQQVNGGGGIGGGVRDDIASPILFGGMELCGGARGGVVELCGCAAGGVIGS